MYRNETNITFQRNPPRFQRTISSVQLFLISSAKEFFGCVFNQYGTVPMKSTSDENLLPFRISFIRPNIWKPPQWCPLRFVSFPLPLFQWHECCFQSLTLKAFVVCPHRVQKFFLFAVIYTLVNSTAP